MILVTLEGLPRTCTSLLKCVTSFASVPCPNPPTPTNAHFDLREEVHIVFSNVLARMLILQHHVDDGTGILLGAHWIDTPPGLSVRGRKALFALAEELKMALAEAFGIRIEKHLHLYVDMNVHECFETLLQSMEARDVMLHDLLSAQAFLKSVAPSHCISMPSMMHDNATDMALTASHISNAIKKWISEA